MQPVSVIDSHTAGEPTRVVLSGGPNLGAVSLAQAREIFGREHNSFRTRVLNEPRGAAHWVGALICAPQDASCVAGVLFFNNTGVLQMCGHGTIGLVATLAHLGHLLPGTHRIETPVGVVSATLHADNRVSLRNLPAFRHAKNVAVQFGDITIYGDVAWGGNWFFLCADHGQRLELSRADELTQFCREIKNALQQHNICGADEAEIDHIELFGPPSSEGAEAGARSRNFVLCPGSAYDRSPCGTGTSAKLACLFADGLLAPGETWRQESILGTFFDGQIEISHDQPNAVIPIITGQAFITAESTLLFDDRNPLRDGVV